MTAAALFGLALVVAGPATGAGWPTLGEGPKAGPGAGDGDAALLVAIETYATVGAIPGARKNIEDWYLYLTRTRGIAPSRVRILRDQEATVERMRKQAAEAATTVATGKTLWVVFIGHGAPAVDGKDGLLVGYDVQQDAESLAARSLPRGELLKIVGAGAQARTNVVIDACFSGRTAAGELVHGLQPLIVVADRAAAEKRTLILSAGAADQFAGPLPGGNRPAFSYLVLGALRGWGDRSGDHKVTAREVIDFSRETLGATLKGRSQTPQLTGEEPDRVLAENAAEAGPDIGQVALAAAPSPRETERDNVGPAALAVAPLAVRSPDPNLKLLGWSFADAVLTRLGRDPAVRVVEREFLESILAEMKLQAGGAVDPATAVRAGRLIGARRFVFGSLDRLGSTVVARARIVNVEGGDVLGVAEATGADTDVLGIERELSRQIAATLSLAPLPEDRPPAEKHANDPTAEAIADLQRLRTMTASLPLWALDPARRRRTAELANAADLGERLTTAFPTWAEAHRLRALVALNSDNEALALAAASEARRLGANDAANWLLFAYLQRRQGDPVAARQTLQAAAQQFPNDARVWFALSRAQLDGGDHAGAVMSLLASEQRAPRVREAETNLRTLVSGVEGAATLTAVERLSPSWGAVARAYRHHFSGDGPDAEAPQVARQSPGFSVVYLRAAAWEQAARRPAQALAWLGAALAVGPDRPDVHRALGLLELERGRCAEGREHLSHYMATETAIGDYAVLEGRLRACKAN
jgi:tetratricopeptide (TPR) repeat protein/TolB-like protein